jgi:hypothetical protein
MRALVIDRPSSVSLREMPEPAVSGECRIRLRMAGICGTDLQLPWSPTGVVRQETVMFVLEHLRMPYVVLGNIGVGPHIRVLPVGVDGTAQTQTVVWGRHSWLLAVVVAVIVVGVTRIISRGRRPQSVSSS